jgi:hypothetical protein
MVSFKPATSSDSSQQGAARSDKEGRMRPTLRDLSSLLTLGGSLVLLLCVDVGLVFEKITLLGSVVGRDEFFVRHVD